MKRVIVLALALLSMLAAGAHAQERMRIAWAGATPTNAPIWVVEERKLLAKHGLTGEIISISASPIAMQALMSGELDVTVTSVTSVVPTRSGGADTVMILGMVPSFPDYLVTIPSVTTIEQLKGKSGGVNRLGSTSDLGIRLALRKLGIDPDKDVKIFSIGAAPERFAALSKGVIQFTSMAEPFTREAEKLGFRTLQSFIGLKIPFWYNAVLSREAIIKARRPALLRLTRAMMEAVHFIKTQKEPTKAIFAKKMRITDNESLERAYRDFAPMYPENLAITPDGVKTLLDDLAPKNPKLANADPRSFLDNSLVQEVEASGFLRQLYQR
ncbi:MAG: ABC transporter substrate-binding protein [Deltaproteobacteria bacterium]|nr:ABC transporter substrate-binding protein [Deltaproteobacteria bacterium]